MDYDALIKKLDDLKDRCETEEVAAIQEAMDIISDYEKAAVNEAMMSRHYEKADKPIYKCGVWVCPACVKKIPYHHSYCHWCGKKVGWHFR